MASKNIVAKGTTYNGVESVTFPVSGGGDATFYEISDTTAAAADVASGKYFYTSSGVKTEGTASGGGGGGLTGLVYESGTFTPAQDIASPTINFTDAHTEPPIFVMIADNTGTYDNTTYSNYVFMYFDWYRFTGSGFYYSSSSQYYSQINGRYRGSNVSSVSNITKVFSINSDDTTSSSQSYPQYFVTASGFKPETDGNNYYRATRTYKWIAVWAPTT